MLTATQDLLTSLEPLPHGVRMKRLAAWARSAPDRAEVCAELGGGESYERHLALVAALVVRDEDAIVAAMGDPQPSIRAEAIVAALRAGRLDSVVDLPAAERRRVYRTVRQRRLTATADALIAEVRPYWGDREAAAVLPACSAAVVRRLLPDLEDAISPATLARRHPGPVLDRAGERLAAAAPEHRDELWNRHVAVLEDLCDPAGFLDLAERYAPIRWTPGSGVLAAHDPARVARLLTVPGRLSDRAGRWLPRALFRALAVLSDDELLPVAVALRDTPRAFAALLRCLPPARRGGLFERASAGSGTLLAHSVMELLPAGPRVREATRVLGLPTIRSRESHVLTWSAYLAWPEASAALEAGLRSGVAEERARAYRLLGAAARRSRDPRVVAELVDRLGRLRNEQDPVRAAALSALTGVARLLTPATAPGLTRLTTGAVEARDASRETLSALASLAAGVLEHHVDVPELREWALHTIDRVAGASPVPVLPRFDQEAMVFERLGGWVVAAMDRGDYGPLFGLTAALGRRAWNVPGLQELLHRAIGPGTSEPVARRAATSWLDDPRRRAERVAAVLDADPSMVAVPEVWNVIATSRTDLIDRVLRGPVRGRMIEDGRRWVPGPPRHADRWLPRQRERFTETLEAVIDDRDESVPIRASAVKVAARVPGPGRDLVRRHIGASGVVVAEAALGALIWTDRPGEALSELLEYAAGDRARVAMYAAARAAAYVEPSRLPALLGGLLTAEVKVTSRKETARVLGRYGPPSVMAALLAAYLRPGTHRDVRAAIVAAAGRRLEVSASWEILDTAASRSPSAGQPAGAAAANRAERRAVLAVDPAAVAERHRRRYAGLIVEMCRAGVREAFGVLPSWARWAEGVRDLVAARLTDLGQRVALPDAAGLLPLLGEEATHAVMANLVAQDEADHDPGRVGTDRPARRRVEVLAEAAATWSRDAPGGADRTPLANAARRLTAQPGYATTGLTMLAALLPLTALDELAGLCATRPVAAVAAAEVLHTRALAARDPEPLRDIASHLASRGDLPAGLFAVAMLRDRVLRWTGPWQQLLFTLRNHPSPEVREAAYAVQMR
ncbi:hypothetical protein ACFY36_14860 [Actinoplanes sp. NPDC000266]